MSVIDDLQAIRKKSAELTAERARRETDLQVARRYRDDALRVLSEEYGVSSVEEAEKELERRGAEFESEVRAVVERLKEVS